MYDRYVLYFFGSQMTGLMGCFNLNCTRVILVRWQLYTWGRRGVNSVRWARVGWLGGVKGVDRSTWEAVCRARMILRNIWWVSWTQVIPKSESNEIPSSKKSSTQPQCRKHSGHWVPTRLKRRKRVEYSWRMESHLEQWQKMCSAVSSQTLEWGQTGLATRLDLYSR